MDQQIVSEYAWISLPNLAAVIFRRMTRRREWAPLCESPIEIDLAVAIVSLLFELLDENKIELKPQYRWRGYRIDFAFVHDGKPRLFVECDGKDFHSSPEQIERDRIKDYAAIHAGIPLLRFSGSEIYQTPYGCVERILTYLVKVDLV